MVQPASGTRKYVEPPDPMERLVLSIGKDARDPKITSLGSRTVSDATLTISSKNYSSWSLRGWLLTKFSGLPFVEKVISPDDPAMRAELLLLSSSFLVPCLTHDGISIWDTLAIGEYLNEICPEAQLLPADRTKRARCRSISGEMHSGFGPMRSALPMNLKGDFPKFNVWARAQADIDRITAIWRDCLAAYGGPFLLGPRSMADAMYAPVVTRFLTYHVKLDPASAAYCRTTMAMPEMIEWVGEAKLEPDDVDELEVEF
jgi:glutathione S-transferase